MFIIGLSTRLVQYIATSLHATSERGGLGPAYVDEFSVCTLSWHRFPVLYRYIRLSLVAQPPEV